MLKYRLRMISKKKLIFWSTFVLLFCVSIGSFVRYYAFASFDANPHVTNVSGDTVYINDLQADWDYYIGLNFTKVTTRANMPGANTELYGEDNLVKVQINYKGRDINGNNWVGYVSSGERQSNFVYYKYFPVENGYVNIELIDNPYAMRPTGKGFNGWVCNKNESGEGVCDDSTFSFDSVYYLRNLKIKANGRKEIVVTLNASWVNAKIVTGNSQENNVNAVGMLNAITGTGTRTVTGHPCNYTLKSTYTNKNYVVKSVANGAEFSGYEIENFSKNMDSVPLRYRQSGYVCEKNICYYLEKYTGEYDTNNVYFVDTGVDEEREEQQTVKVNKYKKIKRTDENGNPIIVNGMYTYDNVVENGLAVYEEVLLKNANIQKRQYAMETIVEDGVEKEVIKLDEEGKYVFEYLDEYENFPVLIHDDIGQIQLYNNDGTPKVDSNGENVYVDLKNTDGENAYKDLTDHKITVTVVYRIFQHTNFNHTNVKKYYDYKLCATTKYSTVSENVGTLTTHTNFDDGDTLGAYYYKTTYSSSSKALLYNSTGKSCSSVTCSGTVYKLIQPNDSIKNGGESIDVWNNKILTAQDGSLSVVNHTDASKYYYLVTRDTNIVIFNEDYGYLTNYSTTKPYTLTADYNGTRNPRDYVVNYYAGGQKFGARSDMVLENLVVDGLNGYDTNADSSRESYNIDLNYYNVKISRTFVGYNRNNNTGYGVYSSSGTGNIPNKKAKFIIESGNYHRIMNMPRAGAQTNINDTRIKVTLGSDYDRAIGDNDRLYVYHRYVDSELHSFHYNSDKNVTTATPVTDLVVKSGTFGEAGGNYSGIYITGINNGASTGYRRAKIEGGKIRNINGGLCFENSKIVNSVVLSLYVTGGNILNVVGGAGVSATSGNRVISITGGTIKNAVSGGSNSSVIDSNSGGALDGDTLVYVGGHAKIGDGTTDSGVNKSGSVFGGGYGANGAAYENRGVVRTSHVIINGGTIAGDVFGGGNYGAVGETLEKNAQTTVDILSGQINGSVFGGANEDGISKSNNYSSRNNFIKVNMSGGTVNGSVYGGSNKDGEIWGKVYVNVTGGTIKSSLYGGSNAAKQMKDSIDVKMSGGTVNGNVFGGTNAGLLVNGSISLSLTGGTINGSAYGCSNNTTQSGRVCQQNGSLNVTLDGTDIGNALYGGSNSSGFVNGVLTMTLKSGRVGTNCNTNNLACGSVYAGGYGVNTRVQNNVKLTTDVTNDEDLLVNNIYGGSGLGSVNKQNSSNTTDVTIKGGTITDSVYGGGMGSDTVDPYTYGDVKVTVNSGTIKNVFGGSNVNGQIPYTNKKSEVYIKGGTIENVFGGSEGELANSLTTNVYVSNGKILNRVYGGGSKAKVNTATNVTITGGVFYDDSYAASIFGGGAEAAATRTNVNINSGSNIYTVYGGSETSGNVGTSYVNLNAGTVACNAYGGGLKASTGTSNINLNGSIFTTTASGNDVYSITCGNAFGGGAEADVTSQSNVNLKGSTLLNVYGGSNKSGTVNKSVINATIGTTKSIFGGNNQGGSTRNTVLYVNGNVSVDNVFGGSNGRNAWIGQTTNVHLNNVNITGSVYGGGNQAPVYGNTNVNMYSGTVGTVYGGGNQAHIGEVTLNGENFATGIKQANTLVNIVSGTINESVFGSGNSSFVYGKTEVNIGQSALNSAPGFTGVTPTVGAITIKKNVFGGSNTNTDGETIWDPNAASAGVIGDVEVNINGGGNYSNANGSIIEIDGSIYGSGNNSSVNGISKINIDNLGKETKPVVINSIQRANYVYLTDSVLELTGERDRAFATQYRYSLIRLDHFYLLGSANGKGSTLFMGNGATFLKEYYSGKGKSDQFVAQTVSGTEGNVKPNTSSTNNKLYMYANVLFAVSDSEKPSYEAGITNAGPVKGMTFLGMYKGGSGEDYNLGMYDRSIPVGTYISEENMDTFSDAYTFVYGEHSQAATEQIKNNGFYTHYLHPETGNMYIDYVGVTPLNADYYKWVIGDEPAIINVDIEATKYSVEGAVNQTISLEELREIVNGQSQEWRDAKMTIQSVDTSKFRVTSDVQKDYDTYLVDRSEIKTINTDDLNGDGIVDANNYFALSMGTTSSGWLDNYKTDFYDTDAGAGFGTDFCSITSAGDCIGSEIYTYDSTTVPRSLTFWLHHSKNLDFDISTADALEDKIIPMGAVTITTEFFNPNGDADDVTNLRTVQIVVNISMRESTSDSYGKAIAPGRKYDKFQGRNTSITADGSFSIFQSISLDLNKPIIGDPDGATWNVDKLYNKAGTGTDKNGNPVEYSEAYRYLASEYPLPVGTTITMLDLITGEQYYYNIDNSNEYNDKALEVDRNGYARYMLEDFIRMGSTSENNKFDDDMNGEDSTKYYTKSGDSKIAAEEFIFNVDFSGVKPEDQIQEKDQFFFYLVLSRDENGIEKPILEPTGEPTSEMIYRLNPNVESKLENEGGYVVSGSDTLSPSTIIYVGERSKLQLDTSLIQEKAGERVNDVNDTEFDDYKLGAKITIWRPKNDENGNPEVGADGKVVYEPITNDLFGTVVTINGVDYYPQTDGSIRLELAGRITDVTSNIDIDFSSSSLTYGEYKLVVETFASYDGLYYGNFNPTYNEFPFELLNNQYGLKVETPPVSVTHDVNTGRDKEGSREIVYTVNTKNGLANPNLKIMLQRRNYNGIYDSTYTTVSLSDIATSLYRDDGVTNLLTEDNCFSVYQDTCILYNLGSIDKNLEGDTYTFTLTLRDGPTEEEINDKTNSKWKSGTYRVVFAMYDDNALVGEVYEYLIIRSLGVDEEVVEGSGN